MMGSGTDYKQLCLVSSVALLVYINGLTGDFLVDDIQAIIKNLDATGLRSVSRLWWNDFWGNDMKEYSSHKSYRPLVILSFRITYYIWKEWTFPYHVTNVVLHAIVTCLFTIFCSNMIFIDRVKWKHGPIVAGLLFASHPVHVEAVTSVVGRSEMFSAILVFVALFAYRKSYFVIDETIKPYVKGIYYDCKSSAENNTHLGCDDRLNKIGDSVGLHKFGKIGFTKSLNQYTSTTTHNAAEGVKSVKAAKACTCSTKLLEPSWLLTIAWTCVTIILTFTAVLCKESGITVMGIALVCEFVYRIEKGFCQLHPLKCCFSYRVAVKIIFIITSGCMMIYFRLWMNAFRFPEFGVGDNPAAYSGNTKTRFLTYSALPWINMWILIFPKFLCWDWCYGTIPLFNTFSDIRNIFTVSFYVSLLTLVFYMCKCAFLKSKNFRPLAISLSIMVLPYIPMSNLFFTVGFTVAERCLYLPSAGYSILVTLFWCAACQKKPLYKRHFQILLTTVILLYVLRTLVRNRDWQDDLALQRSAYAVNPNNARIVAGTADNLHYRENNEKEAEIMYKKCIKLHSRHSGCMGGLGHLYAKRNTPAAQKKAETLLLKGIELDWTEHYTYVVLADLYFNTGRYSKSAQILIDMVRTCGRYDTNALSAYANKLKDAGQLSLAKRVIEQELCRKCDNDPSCAVPDLHVCGVESLMALNIYMHIEWMQGNRERAYDILRKNSALRGGDFEQAKAIFSTIPEELIQKQGTVSKPKKSSGKSRKRKLSTQDESNQEKSTKHKTVSKKHVELK